MSVGEIVLGVLILLWPVIALLGTLACCLCVGKWLLRTVVRIIRAEWQRPASPPPPVQQEPPQPAIPTPADTCLITPTVALIILVGSIWMPALLFLLFAWPQP